MNWGRFPTTERTRIGAIVSGVRAAAVLACALASVPSAQALVSPWPGPRRRGAEEPLQRLIAIGKPIYCGGVRRPDVALTFDDGPGPYTPVALRILRRAHDRATFFVVGRLLAQEAPLVRQEVRLADVGDHTWTHANLQRISPGDAKQQIVETAQALRRLIRRRVVLFRPPYGAHDAKIDNLVHRLGMLEVLWNVDSRDWAGADPAQIAATVEKARRGSIILMHENRGQTLKGLLWMHALAVLRARRLHAVTLTQLLTDDPPTRKQLDAGVHGCGVTRLSPAH
jgi:peptidoglycan/xylan/chitin deacetylase (PgdA/CDA1 family)